MSVLALRYMKAMLAGQTAECIRIEQYAGLYGYPPEVVSVGLAALDAGADCDAAVEEYLSGGPFTTPTKAPAP